MRVKIKKQGGLAIDCRTNVYFKVGDVFAVGDQRFSEEDLTELVRLGYADGIADEDSGSEPDKSEPDKSEPDKSEPDKSDEDSGSESDKSEENTEPEYKTFTTKSDLEDHAKEKYGIDLDKRRTLNGMIEQLENELGGEL